MTDITKRFLLLFVLLVSIYSTESKAQNITIDETLNYINGKFSGKCKVNIKNGELIAEFFDQSMTCIRKDRADIEHLVISKSNYSKEDKMIYLFCDEEECVERKLMGNTKVTRLYDRYPFVWEGDEKSGEGIVKAFNHLIALINEPGYKSNTPFE